MVAPISTLPCGVLFDVAQVLDFLDVDEIAGRLREAVLQADQEVGSAGVDSGFRAMLRKHLHGFVDGGWPVDGDLFHT